MSLKVYVTKNRHTIFKVSKKVNSYVTSQKTESELCSLNGTLFVNLFKALLSKLMSIIKVMSKFDRFCY